MPDENRVFDVTKPKHVSPAPTSRPVIVGHQPMVSDPMVKDKQDEHLLDHTPTKIKVTDMAGSREDHDDHELKTGHESHPADAGMTTVAPAIIEPTNTDRPEPPAEPETGPAKFDPPLFTPDAEAAEPGPEAAADAAPQPEEPAIPDENPEHPADLPPADAAAAPAEDVPEIEPHETTPPAEDGPPHHPNHIEGLHFAEPKSGGRGLKYLVIGLVVLLIAAYLAIDSGLISAGIKLPFHVFKQDQPAATAQSGNSQPPADAPKTTSSLPDGFKLYSLSGTSLTFAAPSTWGEPSSVTEQGYAKRGGSNQTGGTYAYLVSFATNKDVQIAVTSSQFLPPARDRLYYDYLQWCTGTNDGLYYLSVLNYNTSADKIDTPSTITCDQGPVAGALKLDAATLFIAKAKDSAGKTIGDIYVKNLSDKDLPVFRVKDAAMTNGEAIKTLLGTVKFGASS